MRLQDAIRLLIIKQQRVSSRLQIEQSLTSDYHKRRGLWASIHKHEGNIQALRGALASIS